jgi:hypothetical protein
MLLPVRVNKNLKAPQKHVLGLVFGPSGLESEFFFFGQNDFLLGARFD